MKHNESRCSNWNIFTTYWTTTIYVILGGGSGSRDAGGLKSDLSNLGGLNRDHPLIQHVQQNAGLQDPDQATQYTQHETSLLNEQADSSPQEIQSLLGGFLGGGSGSSGDSSSSSQQGGGIGHMLDI